MRNQLRARARLRLFELLLPRFEDSLRLFSFRSISSTLARIFSAVPDSLASPRPPSPDAATQRSIPVATDFLSGGEIFRRRFGSSFECCVRGIVHGFSDWFPWDERHFVEASISRVCSRIRSLRLTPDSPPMRSLGWSGRAVPSTVHKSISQIFRRALQLDSDLKIVSRRMRALNPSHSCAHVTAARTLWNLQRHPGIFRQMMPGRIPATVQIKR